MKRFFVLISILLTVAGCSLLGKPISPEIEKNNRNTAKPLSAEIMRESCCFEDSEIQAAMAAEECIPSVQRVKLVSTCESCSAFVVSAKTRKSCDK